MTLTLNEREALNRLQNYAQGSLSLRQTQEACDIHLLCAAVDRLDKVLAEKTVPAKKKGSATDGPDSERARGPEPTAATRAGSGR